MRRNNRMPPPGRSPSPSPAGEGRSGAAADGWGVQADGWDLGAVSCDLTNDVSPAPTRPALCAVHPPLQGRESARREGTAVGGEERTGSGWGRRPRSVDPALVRGLRRRLTPQEARLWVRLKQLKAQGMHFRKQVPIETFVIDFACLSRKLLIEIDGDQHGQLAGQARDAWRDGRLTKLGFRVLRFWNHEVNFAIESVLDTIFEAATNAPGRDDCGR